MVFFAADNLNMLHLHHIIPRHAGGSDGEENIVLLTIEEHAEAHRILYEKFGRWQDKTAWLGLSAQIGKQELNRLARENGHREFLADKKRVAARAAKAAKTLREKYKIDKFWSTGKKKTTDVRVKKLADGLQKWYGDGGKPWNKDQNKSTHEGCLKISENTKKQAKDGNFHCIGDYQRGRTFDMEHRTKLSERALKRSKKKCAYCNITVTPAMYARWHGDKCKNKT